jgi:UDP-N-acetylglucosamine 2-epimerase (non-hydrolysing)
MENEKIRPIILIVGTRPEGIKMAPVYWALKKVGLPVKLCSTMQHGELLEQVLPLFGICPDYSLDIMRPGQDLFYLTHAVLQKTKEVFIRENPALVIVQGDTTSTMAAALSAFYLQVPIAHIEAGLRTDDLYAPYPEEMNRRVVSMLAQYHFAPTKQAVENLYACNIAPEKIFCVGNTVVDALRIIVEKIDAYEVAITSHTRALVHACTASLLKEKDTEKEERAFLQPKRRKLLVLTAHRRESFHGGIERILLAVKQILEEKDDLSCIYPFHPNPQVLKAIETAGLDRLENCFLCEPLIYSDLVYVLSHADLVMTDSGGIQEEAISLGKPTLVLREKTERTEGIQAGIAFLVGNDGEKIKAKTREILVLSQDKLSVPNGGLFSEENAISGHRAYQANTLYGDGHAAEKIAAVLLEHLPEMHYSREVAIEQANDDPVQKEGTQVKKVVVVGLGYIGLPTALVSVEHGLEVVGVDIDAERVEKINAGMQVIYEPEVYEKLQLALQSGHFKAQSTLESADYIIVAVPTPCTKKKAELSYVFAATESIASVVTKGATIILESTVPVGTTKKMAEILSKKTGLIIGQDFFVAHCPERVLPGKIFHELIENDRVIGGVTPACAQKAQEFYEHFVRGAMYRTNAEAAEMVKLVENSSRDVQIAFANQVGAMAYAQGLDPYEIIELANKHPRVNILKPSCGVGGHCIAVDPWFLIETYPQQTQLLQSARDINDKKPLQVIAAVCSAVEAFEKQYGNKFCTVAVMGLTYKADVDDLRESPALIIAKRLQEYADIKLLVCEPHVRREKLEPLFGTACKSATEAIEQADIVLFLVPHTRFKALDKKILYNKKVMDVCGLLYKSKLTQEDKEPLFWPARSVLDFFIVNQENEQCQLREEDTLREDHS